MNVFLAMLGKPMFNLVLAIAMFSMVGWAMWEVSEDYLVVVAGGIITLLYSISLFSQAVRIGMERMGDDLMRFLEMEYRRVMDDVEAAMQQVINEEETKDEDA